MMIVMMLIGDDDDDDDDDDSDGNDFNDVAVNVDKYLFHGQPS